MKIKYEVRTSDGRVFTRTSGRTYLYCVVSGWKAEWRSSLRLAQQLASSYQGRDVTVEVLEAKVIKVWP